jgi:hypothetical protein
MSAEPTAVNGRAPGLPSRGVTAPTSVSIALPAGDYVGVARLVAAGIATRLALRYEAVDDLQLAIEAVLRSAFGPDDHATIAIASDDRSLSVAIGPVAPGALEWRLHEHDDPGGIELGKLLVRLVDSVTVQLEPLASIVLGVDLAAGAV